jgi:hypothetical protein
MDPTELQTQLRLLNSLTHWLPIWRKKREITTHELIGKKMTEEQRQQELAVHTMSVYFAIHNLHPLSLNFIANLPSILS